jgi:glycosyltransferase involved in cell wall biosynthesis
MYYDQIWGNFIPAFFDNDDYFVLRDERYNVAYWNLHHTGKYLAFKDGLPTMKGSPVVFFHFSGMAEEFDESNSITRHQNRYFIQDFPDIGTIIKAYVKLVADHDASRYKKIPYGYSSLDNGIKLKPFMRTLYAEVVFGDWMNARAAPSPYKEHLSMVTKMIYRDSVHPNPFCTSLSQSKQSKCFVGSNSTYDRTFVQWLLGGPYRSSIIDLEGKFYFSELEERVLEMRPDVQAAFPDPKGGSYDRFKRWFQRFSAKEELIDEVLLALWEEQWEKERYKQKAIISQDSVGANVFGWHTGMFGVGKSGSLLIRAFRKAGMHVNAILLDDDGSGTHAHTDLTSRDLNLTRHMGNPVNIFIVNADTTPFVKSQVPRNVWNYMYNIAYWEWELEDFPFQWMVHLKAYDEIWASSKFIADSITTSKGYDGTPVRVVWMPLEKEPVGDRTDLSISSKLRTTEVDDLSQFLDVSEDTFIFLVVFDFLSLVERKNPHGAIRAFKAAFPKQEQNKEVRLIIKSINGNAYAETKSALAELEKMAQDDPRVIFVTGHLPESTIKALVQRANCYLSLHRSEGYGISIIQSMSRGKPVIATNYSGNADFFPAVKDHLGTCHFPIPYKLVRLGKDFGPYPASSKWADPDHDAAVRAMQAVVHSDCSSLYKDSIANLLDQFGQEAIGKRVRKFLLESKSEINRSDDE